MGLPARDWLESKNNQELMILFQNGEESAFDTLMQRFQDPLYSFIVRMLNDKNCARDILQDTFLKVWEKRHQYKEIGQFSTWVYTIATNLVRTELRKRKIRRWIPLSTRDSNELEIDPQDPNAGPEELANSSDLRVKINQALKKLPVEYREVIILRDINDLSYEEVAQVLKIPLGTVKSRVNRGRQKMQEMLKEYL
ncbi:MAG: sigma-70 family RNA polymerase sigma factor [bacterium]|nr:sigma-70 family RNA polymerase sigma factor [bacterium]